MATAFYMVADVETGELCYSIAGHPSPIRVQRAEAKLTLLSSFDPRHGPALGLFEKPEFPTSRCPLQAGDLFLLYTDGIYEASNSRGEEYGRDRLFSEIRNHLDTPTERLLDAVVTDVQGFARTREFDDDVCLVAMDVAQT